MNPADSDGAGLPSFFQFQGQSISEGLLEFELGGDFDDLAAAAEEDEVEAEVDEADLNDLTFGGGAALSLSLSDLMKDLPKPTPVAAAPVPVSAPSTAAGPPGLVKINPTSLFKGVPSNGDAKGPPTITSKPLSYAAMLSGPTDPPPSPAPASSSSSSSTAAETGSSLLKYLKGSQSQPQPQAPPSFEAQSFDPNMGLQFSHSGFQLPPPNAANHSGLAPMMPPMMHAPGLPPQYPPHPHIMHPHMMPPPPPHFLPPHMMPPPGSHMPMPMPMPMSFPPPHFNPHQQGTPQAQPLPPHQLGGPPPPRPFQPYRQQQPYNRPNNRRVLPTGKKMGTREVEFVVAKTVDPMKSVDPFATDYYNIQYKIKQNERMRDEAIRESQNQQSDGSSGTETAAIAKLPPMLFIPLPTWKDTKDRIRQQIEDTNKHYHDRARKWVEKEKVLGQNIKSDHSRPKEVLSVPSFSELNAADDIEGDGSLRMPYSSRLWNMRQAVQKGYEALYTVQELQYLLHTPVVVANVVSYGEIMREIDTAINVLAQSLGIRVHSNASANGNNIGEVSAAPVVEISLEGGLVAAILQTAKGKRLLSRSLQLLPPDHRWALLPAILARILQVNPTDQPEEDKAVEQKLIKTLLEFINHTHQFQQDLQAQKASASSFELPQSRGPVNPDTFAREFLTNLRQCVKSVMVSFMEKSQLRQALLSSRARAEVMHIIVQVGDKVSEQVEVAAVADWVHLREAFMSMLDN